VWSEATHLGFIFLIVTNHGLGNGWIGGGNFGHCSAVLSDVTVECGWAKFENVVTASRKGEMRFHGVLHSSHNIASSRLSPSALLTKPG